MNIRGIELNIIKGDIADLSVEAVVNPAHASLVMARGLALAIKDKGGEQIEREALSKAPVAPGDAVVTGAGRLKASHVIHAAVMDGEAPARETHIRLACAGALRCAQSLGIRSLALPALGCGAGGFPPVGAAKIMAQEILKFARFQKTELKEIIICLSEDALYEIFVQTIRGYIDHIQDTLGLGPYVTVDAIIEFHDGIILIERSNPPYGWALPGGFVDCGESLEEAVRREAREETGLDLLELRQMHTYSDPQRDPRFHTVSTVFVAQGQGVPRFGDDARGLKVVKYQELLDLDYAFDHKKVIADYLAGRDRDS